MTCGGRDDAKGSCSNEEGVVMQLTEQQLAYLRGVYRLCGAKPGACADSRAVATAIGATEDERMDLEDALAQGGYIVVGSAPGTVGLTARGRRAVT
jgi:hypothetical protein